MSFLVNRLSVQPAELKQIGATSPQALQAIARVLSTGKILEVVINQERKTGRRGFTLFGQFIPATVPETVRDGQRLKVKVSEADDSLVLKIVDDTSAEGDPESGHPLEEIVSDKAMHGLRSGSRPEGVPLDLNQFKEIEASQEAPPEVKFLIRNFLSLIEKFSRQKELVADHAAADPAELERALIAMSEKDDIPTRKRKKRERNEDIRRLLDEIVETMEKIDHTSSHGAELASLLTPLKQASGALDKLQRAFEGRELTSDLNVISGKIGQASYLMIPSLVDGKLQNWEMQFDPRETEIAHRSGKEGTEQTPFCTLHLFLHFNSIGAVRIDLATRSSECLIRATFAEQEVATFAQARSEKLRNSLNSLGIGKLELKFQHGNAMQVKPPWVAELTKLHTST